jgi:hypothetical protein
MHTFAKLCTVIIGFVVLDKLEVGEFHQLSGAKTGYIWLCSDAVVLRIRLRSSEVGSSVPVPCMQLLCQIVSVGCFD